MPEGDLGENDDELKPLVVVLKFSVASVFAKKPSIRGERPLN